MKIAMINASPRLMIQKNDICTSNIILQDCRRFLRRFHVHDFEDLHLKTGYLSEKDKAALLSCDTWLIAYPLYMLALPSHLMMIMKTLEEEAQKGLFGEIKVYAIGNMDSYDGNNAYLSFRMLALWCEKCGFAWCGGMGIGGGFQHRVHSVRSIALGGRRTYSRRLSVFAEAISKRIPTLNTNSSPDINRKSFMMQHNQYYRREAKRLGVTVLDISQQP